MLPAGRMEILRKQKASQGAISDLYFRVLKTRQKYLMVKGSPVWLLFFPLFWSLTQYFFVLLLPTHKITFLFIPTLKIKEEGKFCPVPRPCLMIFKPHFFLALFSIVLNNKILFFSHRNVFWMKYCSSLGISCPQTHGFTPNATEIV